ncbi:hypothetical protein V6N13_114365 [Hibiscus sabdariffa]
MLQPVTPAMSVLPGTAGRSVYFGRSSGSIRRALHPDAYTVLAAVHPYATSDRRLFYRSVPAIQLDDGRSFPFSCTFLSASIIFLSTAGSYLRF